MSSELKEAVCVCVWKGGGWGLQAVLAFLSLDATQWMWSNAIMYNFVIG